MRPGRSHAALKTLALVAALAFVPALPATATPNVDVVAASDLRPYQWGLDAVNAEAAWRVTQGAGVRVGVLDSGVDPKHPDLAGRVDPGADVSIKPYAVVSSDEVGHGTHVAGIIAGSADGRGISGVAPAATIVPIKVTSSGRISENSLVAGLQWATTADIDVLNLSLGGSAEPLEIAGTRICAAIKDLVSSGVTVVAAAGNDGFRGNPMNVPAACDGVISVAALNSQLGHAFFSSFDESVDISAPGADIYSSVPVEQTGFEVESGTSMAAPFVTGVAALVKAAHPDASPAEVTAALTGSATDIGPRGDDPEFGAGLVNAAEALGVSSDSHWSTRPTVVDLYPALDQATDLTVIVWAPPAGQTVHGYSIVSAPTGAVLGTYSGKTVRALVPSSVVAAAAAVQVVAHTDSGDLGSAPRILPGQEQFASATPPLKVAARWVKAGLRVTVGTHGDETRVDTSLGDAVIPAGRHTVTLRVPANDAVRELAVTVVARSPRGVGTTSAPPQFNVSAVAAEAGKRLWSIEGFVPCETRRGCSGQQVAVYDASGLKIAETVVTSGLEFTVLLPRSSGPVRVGFHEERSRTVTPAETADE